MTPEPPTRTESEAADTARALRAAFCEAARSMTPPPVPLEAIERAGRARRRRRATALTTGCALAVTAVTLTLTQVLSRPTAPDAARPPVPAQEQASTPRPSSKPSRPPEPPAPPRIVAPGERVDAGGGWTVWLTRSGKHWKGPDGYENVRSVSDGNIDMTSPGISHQSEGDRERTFHSGLYYGTRSVGRVELTDAAGRRTTAALLELPGKPGWGVWYTTTPSTPGGAVGSDRLDLYDSTGRLITSFPPR